MQKTILLFCALFSATLSHAQLSIAENATPYVIDFDATVSGVNNGTYAGTGFADSPSAGQLDGNAWEVTDLSDDTHTFDEDGNTSGDFARGTSTGGAGTGGLYAFEVSAGNYAFGFQPNGSDLTPGSIRLKLANATGSVIGKLVVSYTVYVYNDQDRANEIRFEHDANNANYLALSGNTITSTETADVSPAWVAHPQSVTLDGLNISNGGNYYISWATDDVSGSGTRDEFAIDDIRITAYTLFAYQGFESSIDDNWNITYGSDKISSADGSGDTPSDNRIFAGSNSWQVHGTGGAHDTLILDAFSTVGYKDVEMVFRLSSTSGNASNGADGADIVKVFGAYNGNDFSSDPEISITGDNNARWSFLGEQQLQLSTAENNVGSAEISFAPSGGGDRDDDGDGYAYLKLNLADGYESFSLKIDAENNADNERWNIDHVYLVGDHCDYGTTQASGASATNITGNTADISFTPGTGDSTLVLIREAQNVNTFPICGTDYSASTSFGSGDELITSSGNYVVYYGAGSSFSVSSLSANTTYYLSFFDADNLEYNTPGYDFSFTTCDSEGIGVNEAFDGGTTAPSNWTFTNIGGTYTSVGNFGDATPSLQLDATGDTLITPVICNTPTVLSFWIKGQSTDATSTLKIEGSADGINWTQIDEINNLPTSESDGFTQVYGEDAISSFNQFRFSYIKSAGNLALDDVVILSGETGGQSYTWDGGGVDNALLTDANWNPSRSAYAVDDELLFSDGGSSTVSDIDQLFIEKLQLTNGSQVTLSAVSGGGDIYINGAVTDDDNLAVCATCTLTLSGTEPLRLHLLNDRSSNIAGTIVFTGSQAHQILTSGSNDLSFDNGSTFYNSATDNSNGTLSPFGGSNPYENTVVFTDGSSYYSNGTAVASPFGLEAPDAVVTFNSGATFYFENSGAQPDLDNRNYANFYYNRSATVTVTTGSNGFTVDSLLVLDGQFKINSNYNTTVNGNLGVRGGDSLVFDPSSSQNLTLNASNGLLVNTSGGLRFGSQLELDIASGSYTTEGSFEVDGDFTMDGTSFTISEEDSIQVEGTLSNSGNFVLENSASLIQTTGSSLSNTGSFEATRDIPAGGSTDYYYFWSSPMTGGSGAEVGPTGALSGARIFKFTPGGNESSDYISISADEAMVPGQGYAVRGLSSLTTTGTVNNGDIDISITETADAGSYTMVGNPYPSAINASEFISANSNIEGTVYLWSYDNTEAYTSSAQFIAINAAGSSAATDRDQTSATTHIASCQGFFVNANDALADGDYTLTFTNAMRNGTNNHFKSNAGVPTLEKNWIYVSHGIDTAAMMYTLIEDATWKFDHHYDARSFSADTRIAAVWEDHLQSIFAIPRIKKTTVIPLQLDISSSGTYTLGMIPGLQLDDHFTPRLLDTESNALANLAAGETLQTTLSPNSYQNRFYLILSRTGETTALEEIANRKTTLVLRENSVSIMAAVPIHGQLQVLDLKGSILFQTRAQANTTIALPHLQTGLYLVTWTDATGNRITMRWNPS